MLFSVNQRLRLTSLLTELYPFTPRGLQSLSIDDKRHMLLDLRREMARLSDFHSQFKALCVAGDFEGAIALIEHEHTTYKRFNINLAISANNLEDLIRDSPLTFIQKFIRWAIDPKRDDDEHTNEPINAMTYRERLLKWIHFSFYTRRSDVSKWILNVHNPVFISKQMAQFGK